LSQFNFFHNDWLEYDDFLLNNKGSIPVNIDVNFINNIQLDKLSLKNYRIAAAKLLSIHLGNKIALCLSGGIDSQAMVQCFVEANIPFDLYTLVFNKNLNEHDIVTAREFAEKLNIKINYLDLNIIQFLAQENYNYGVRYKSASPHFNTHYKMFNLIREKGYSGIVAGGFIPLRSGNQWGINYNYNVMNFIHYCTVENFYAHGNFLSFYPQLSWAIALLTPNDYDHDANTSISTEKSFYDEGISKRYDDKIKGYLKAGFDIIPQVKKFTGFEEVKNYYENITGDGWTFEKRFRFPLNTLFGYKTKPKFDLNIDTVNLLNLINDNNTASSI